MEFADRHREALESVLRWRRDSRHFRTEPLAPEVLPALERAVEYAPSVGNSRPWRFVRVWDAEARAAVIRSFETENARAAGLYAGEERAQYQALKLAGLREAPVHLAVFTDTAPAAGRGLGRQTMPETLAYSTAMAIHTLWLAARSWNVGVGWVSILDPETVAHALGAPEHWDLTGYLCLGYEVEAHATPELERVGWQSSGAPRWSDL